MKFQNKNNRKKKHVIFGVSEELGYKTCDLTGIIASHSIARSVLSYLVSTLRWITVNKVLVSHQSLFYLRLTSVFACNISSH